MKKTPFLWFLALFLSLQACKLKPGSVPKPVDAGRSQGSTQADSLFWQPDPYSTLLRLHTPEGSMDIELFFHTGEHRQNMLRLVQAGFYDSLAFHRVIKGFMLQGGDPDSRQAKPKQMLGGGGPGYELEAEINSRFFHLKGALAAARTADEVNPLKKSSGSQFYIVHGSPVAQTQLDRIERQYNIAYSSTFRRLYEELGGAPQLDMEYTVFGRVYKGLDVLDRLALWTVDGMGKPQEKMWMVWEVIKE